jgi:NAD(P)-dependent dehydrogenase (short-subunit alcohol dehydrogenase family)
MDRNPLESKSTECSHLEGRNVVVMGGSSGIGLATAKALARVGAAVTITGRDPERLNSAAREAGLRTAVSDATSSQALEGFYKQHGPFDHLILSIAGREGGGPFRALDLDSLRLGFENKYWTQVRAAQLALKTLRRNGSITFITSSSARRPNPNTSGLAAINGALETMVQVLAAELTPLRINAVSPGVVDTPFWNRLPIQQRETMQSSLANSAAVGRIGRPEEIADAICFWLATTS